MAPTNKKPEPGDLIEIFRGGYQHWAIYVGDGYLIHVAPPSEYAQAGSYSMMSVLCDRAKVKKEEFCVVVGNDKYCINNLLDDKYMPRPICDIIQEALSLVGAKIQYSVHSMNCEHFVTALRYGKPESRQVQTAVEVAVGSGLALAGVGLVAYAVGVFDSKTNEKQKQ